MKIEEFAFCSDQDDVLMASSLPDRVKTILLAIPPLYRPFLHQNFKFSSFEEVCEMIVDRPDYDVTLYLKFPKDFEYNPAQHWALAPQNAKNGFIVEYPNPDSFRRMIAKDTHFWFLIKQSQEIKKSKALNYLFAFACKTICLIENLYFYKKRVKNED